MKAPTRKGSLVLRLVVSTALVVGSLAMPVAARAALIPTVVPIDSNFTVTDLNHGVTAADLANELVGGGVAVSNVTYTGSVRAGGTFTVNDPTTLGFVHKRGVVLSSGKVQTVAGDTPCGRGIEGPNNCHEAWTVPGPGAGQGPDGSDNTTAFGTPGDAQLTTLSGHPTFDASILEFDFVPQGPTVQFKYVFSSEEYSNFANTQFNDVFAFYVNGVNCALVPGTNSPVAVDTVNNGNDQTGGDPTPHNAAFFRDNVRPAPTIDIQVDGLTTVFSCVANANPGVPNHMKLAIADASDQILDSAVFLEGGSLISGVDTTLHGGGQSGPAITVFAGTPVTDSAKVIGPNSATAAGTMTYNVYTHTTPGCTTLFTAAGIKTVTNGMALDSNPVVFLAPGVYDWVASYSGDPISGNLPSANPCGSEEVTVQKASPTITTSATAAATAGGTISDTATLALGAAPTGTITFNVYGPADPTCAGTAVATSSATVTANANYSSSPYTANLPGNYHWTALYDGDVKNNPANTLCGDAGETSVVTKANPTITTTATTATAGGSISDTATLAGGAAPTGTITFNLYGPADPTCAAAPVATSTATVNGNGTYASGSFDAIAAGTYHWVAMYSSDAHNNGAATHCGDAGETSAVGVPTSTPGCDIDGAGRIVASNGDRAKFTVDFGSETASENDEDSGSDQESGNNGDEESENVQTYRDLGPKTPFTFVSTANTAAVCNGKTSGSIYGTGLVNGTTPVAFIIDVTSGNAQEDGNDDKEGQPAATYRIRLSNGYDSGVQTLRSGHISVHLESDEEDNQDNQDSNGKHGDSQHAPHGDRQGQD